MSGHRMRALDRPPEASAEIAECSAISGSIASSALAALRSGCQEKPPTVRFASIASAPSNYSVNLQPGFAMEHLSLWFRYTPCNSETSSAKWQRAKWSGRTSRSKGASRRQRSSANRQRGWK